MKKFVEWLGTLSSVTGAFLVPLGFTLIGYCAFMCGALIWLAIGIVTKNNALAFLNFTFLCANVLGIAKNLL